MPLSSDDIQATQVAHEVPFLLHVFGFFDLLDQSFPLLLGDIQTRLVLVLELSPSLGFGVSAQDDVRTTARHIRGDRH